MDGLLMPLKVAEAWVMVTIHKLLVAIGMSDGPGPAWVLSIVGLTVAVRVLIMPLFVKQIRSSRGMQAMQPELRALQNKYKGKKDPASQERMREEMMALYRKHGTNPLSSCLPMLIQIPIFFALFRVLARLQEIANSAGSAHPVKIGPLTPALAADVQASSLFGAPLSSSFMNNGGSATVKIVTMVLIVLMTATQFYTMHQLTMKNMPKSVTESDNPAMRSQRMMMYGMPLIFFITGPQFQVGVLIYWLVSNVWTMGQQWWTIRNMPAVGSEAYKKRQERRRRKGLPPDDEKKPAAGSEDEAASSGPGQRVQPVRNNRKKKKNRTASTAEQRYAERARERQQAFNASGAKDDGAKGAGGAANGKSGNKSGSAKKKKGSKGGNSAKK